MTEQEYIRINRKYEVYYMPKVRAALHVKTRAVIHALQTSGFDGARNYLHTDLANDALVPVIKDLYTRVGKRHAQAAYSRLLPETRGRKSAGVLMEHKGFGFNEAWTNFILNYLDRFLTQKITFAIAETTRAALLRAISVATIQGLSVQQTVDSLTDWPHERFQAARIVRTEVNRAANVGEAAQADTSEFQQNKTWHSADDYRVRGRNPKDHADHWSLNGVMVDEDDKFHDPVSGDYLEMPGDPTASAATTINCRCKATHTFKRDKDGELIRKRKTTVVIYPGQIRRPQTVLI